MSLITKENQNIEWKESWHNDYFKWICAFANAQGGTLFIGMDDNGVIMHVDKAKKLLEDLPNQVRDLLGLMVDVNLHTKEGTASIFDRANTSFRLADFFLQFYN